MKNKSISRRTFLIGGAALLPYLYFQTRFISVTRYTIPVNKLPPDFHGFTILHLTDLHSKEYGDNQEKLLNLIKKQQFDIVAITGDMVVKNNPSLEPSLQLIRGLKNTPVYFVPGNHDQILKQQMQEAFTSLGVQVLENRAEKIVRGDSHFWVLGVDDPYLGLDRLDLALQGVDESSTRILLAHAPEILPAAKEGKIDLVLVGHTHGGQVRLPFLGAVVIPGQGLFPQYDYGLFTSGTTQMIINSGLGESILPIRFNIRPEITLITLVSAT